MMEEKNSKKVFLSVLGVAILIVAVVGISFAVFSFTNTTGTRGENTITTGVVTMSYAEPANGILLNNALPITDAQAMQMTSVTSENNAQVEVFQFNVTVTANGTITVPYEINIEKLAAANDKTLLDDNEVRIALTKGTTLGDENEVVVEAAQGMDQLLVSGNQSTLRSGTYTIHDESDIFTAGTTAPANSNITYNLRMWVASTAEAQNFLSTDQYRIKVHVDSKI